jgi:hypothetical protein
MHGLLCSCVPVPRVLARMVARSQARIAAWREELPESRRDVGLSLSEDMLARLAGEALTPETMKVGLWGWEDEGPLPSPSNTHQKHTPELGWPNVVRCTWCVSCFLCGVRGVWCVWCLRVLFALR